MKKKVLPLLALSLLSVNLFAQQQVDNTNVIPTQYTRNSLSLIEIEHGDNLDYSVGAGLRAVRENLGEKFDANDIETKSIVLGGSRNDSKVVNDSLITKAINNANVGRQIISYWFDRKSDGSMSIARAQQRSRMNATDQDILNDQAAQVKTLNSANFSMIKKSFVIVMDVHGFEKGTKSIGKDLLTASADGYVYQIDLQDDWIGHFNKDIYIDKNDSPSVVATKRQNYENWNVPMKYLKKVSATGTGVNENAALASVYQNLVEKAEKKINDWKVTTPVMQVHPIMAKIGKKEGLSNGSRYLLYKFREDADGNLIPVTKGYVRATTVVDNRGEATGNSEMSQFFKIAGGKTEEGMILQQANDTRIGVSIAGQFGGKTVGNVRVDYLAYIQNSGISHYGIVTIGADLTKLKGIYGYYEYTFEKQLMYTASIGYGCSLPFIRIFELQPYAQFGIDYMALKDDNMSESQKSHYMGYYVNGGLRFSITIVYPLSVFVQADYTYSLKSMSGDVYNAFNNENAKGLLGTEGGLFGRDSGLSFGAGFRYAF